MVRHPVAVVVEPLALDALEAFIEHVDAHLAENGSEEVGYFQPVPRAASTVSPAKADAIRDGLRAAVASAGWRRAWVARAGAAIVGHVDLRARPEPFTSHRCLLGMGVHRDWRRAGIGRRLLDAATAWAVATPALDWIDLDVLATNLPAIRLYETAGFARAGELADLFRIDGVALGSLTMVKRLRDVAGDVVAADAAARSAASGTRR